MKNTLWGLLKKKEDGEESKATVAHLGEDNQFYYNEKLGRWVIKGEEDLIENEPKDTGPPKITETANGNFTFKPMANEKKTRNAFSMYAQTPGLKTTKKNMKMQGGIVSPYMVSNQEEATNAEDPTVLHQTEDIHATHDKMVDTITNEKQDEHNVLLGNDKRVSYSNVEVTNNEKSEQTTGVVSTAVDKDMSTEIERVESSKGITDEGESKLRMKLLDEVIGEIRQEALVTSEKRSHEFLNEEELSHLEKSKTIANSDTMGPNLEKPSIEYVNEETMRKEEGMVDPLLPNKWVESRLNNAKTYEQKLNTLKKICSGKFAHNRKISSNSSNSSTVHNPSGIRFMYPEKIELSDNEMELRNKDADSMSVHNESRNMYSVDNHITSEDMAIPNHYHNKNKKRETEEEAFAAGERRNTSGENELPNRENYRSMYQPKEVPKREEVYSPIKTHNTTVYQSSKELNNRKLYRRFNTAEGSFTEINGLNQEKEEPIERSVSLKKRESAFISGDTRIGNNIQYENQVTKEKNAFMHEDFSNAVQSNKEELMSKEKKENQADQIIKAITGTTDHCLNMLSTELKNETKKHIQKTLLERMDTHLVEQEHIACQLHSNLIEIKNLEEKDVSDGEEDNKIVEYALDTFNVINRNYSKLKDTITILKRAYDKILNANNNLRKIVEAYQVRDVKLIQELKKREELHRQKFAWSQRECYEWKVLYEEREKKIELEKQMYEQTMQKLKKENTLVKEKLQKTQTHAQREMEYLRKTMEQEKLKQEELLKRKNEEFAKNKLEEMKREYDNHMIIQLDEERNKIREQLTLKHEEEKKQLISQWESQKKEEVEKVKESIEQNYKAKLDRYKDKMEQSKNTFMNNLMIERNLEVEQMKTKMEEMKNNELSKCKEENERMLNEEVNRVRSELAMEYEKQIKECKQKKEEEIHSLREEIQKQGEFIRDFERNLLHDKNNELETMREDLERKHKEEIDQIKEKMKREQEEAMQQLLNEQQQEQDTLKTKEQNLIQTYERKLEEKNKEMEYCLNEQNALMKTQMQNEMAELLDKIDKLENEMQVHMNSKRELEMNLSLLNEEKQNIVNRNKILEDSLKSNDEIYNKNMNALKDDNERLKKQLNETAEKVREEIGEEYGDILENEVQRIKKQMEVKLSEYVKMYEEAKEEAKSKKEEFSALLEKSNKKTQELTEKYEENIQKISKYEEMIEKLKNQSEDMVQNRIEELNNEFIKEKEKLEKEKQELILEMEQERKKEEGKMVELQNIINELNDKNNKLHEEKKEEDEKRNKMEEQVHEMKEKLKELQKKYDSLVEVMEEKNEEKKLEDKIKNLENTNESLLGVIEKERETNMRSVNVIKHLQEQMNEQTKDYENKMKEMNKEIEELKEKGTHSKLIEENTKLRLENEITTTKNDNISVALDCVTKRLSFIENKIKDHELGKKVLEEANEHEYSLAD